MSDFDTADLDVFLDDFDTEIQATTWGTEFCGIFDQDYVEIEDMSRTTPTLVVKTSDVPTTADSGDLFTVADVDYKLVDVRYEDPGLTRLVLALA